MQDVSGFFPDTYIKNVVIEVQGEFQFDNFPHPPTAAAKDRGNKPFIGRDSNIRKFVKMLEHKGVFLVTGYRGMGKTSFVNVVLNKYDEKKKGPGSKLLKLKEIRLTVAQAQPSEADILRLLVSTLREECKPRIDRYTRLNKKIIQLIKGLLTIATIIFLVFAIKTLNVPQVFEAELGIGSFKNLEILLKATMAVFFTAAIILLVLKFLNIFKIPRAFDDLENLYKRCYASTSYGNDGKGEISFDSIGSKLSYTEGRKTEVYPIASSKEIEFQLSRLIGTFKKKHKLAFVFIFDELDKIEQEDTRRSDEQNAESAYLGQLRDRKEIIQGIFTGLKNFLNSTDAAFIFIAGREMFEASMADIADRQSSISSVFTYVFYVESLLKENIIKTSSLSAAIEEYLYNLIHNEPPQDGKTIYTTLDQKALESKFFNTSNCEAHIRTYRQNAVKVNMFLQQFVVYLTYRSNGSPKKLIRLIHEFIRVDLPNDHVKDMIVWPNSPENGKKIGPCLYFDYKQQQRIGFISYLYRPFLIKYGNSFKQLSDNLVVSTSFLFDHLLKFHPFAFSHTHIELVPEILAANRTPVLREHIKKIIDYLSLNHLKETDVGLFDYKFYSKTVNEIIYLSKSFEEESAAFNFTLDESHLIKVHVKSKLKDLRARYVGFASPDTGVLAASSIAYLNDMLGDLHFFDQEYDQAIVAYSDALQSIKVGPKMSMHDFILTMKYKLKLGLTFEKIKSFEECLSLYSDSVVQAKKFVKQTVEDKLQDKDDTKSITSSLSDILQIISQTFLAALILEEKLGLEGITARKSTLTMGGFLSTAELVAKSCGLNSTVVSNFFLHAGNLLYFKNSVKAFEWNLDRKPTDSRLEHEFLKDWPSTYLDDINTFKKINSNLYLLVSKEYRFPITALNLYSSGLKYLLNGRVMGAKMAFTKHDSVTTILKAVFPDELKPYFSSLSKIHFKYIAIYLSNIGDCLLSMLCPPKTLEKQKEQYYQVKTMFDVQSLESAAKMLAASPNDGNISWLKSFITSHDKPDRAISLQTIICYYYLSSYYFNLCSVERSRGFQLRKILYSIRLVASEDQKNAGHAEMLVSLLERLVVKEILEIGSRNSEYSDVHDFKKFQKEFQNIPILELNKVLNNLSNSPDSREAIILLSHIKLRLLSRPAEEFEKVFSNDYALSTQYLRLLELTYAAKYFQKKIKELVRRNCPDLEFELECDAVSYLHSLSSVIEIMEVYDNDYLVGHSFIAYHHLRIGHFFDFNNGINYLGVSEPLAVRARERMEGIIKDQSSRRMFDSYYNYRMAALYYNKAMKLHNAGDEYKKAISDILYLEDDLSDSAYHFGAAMDRHLMVIGKFTDLEDELSKKDQPSWKSFSAFMRED